MCSAGCARNLASIGRNASVTVTVPADDEVNADDEAVRGGSEGRQ